VQPRLVSLAPHDLRRTCAELCHVAGGELEQIQFLLGHMSVQTTEHYLGCRQRLKNAVNDCIGIEPEALQLCGWNPVLGKTERGREIGALALSPQVDVSFSIYGGVTMATLQQSIAGFSVGTVPDLSRKETQARLSLSAVPAFFKLAEAWHLRDDAARQLLGGVSNGVFYQMKSGQRKTLDQDKLTRLSLLFGIFKGLNLLYSRKLADVWVNLPNSNLMFEGETPLAYMIKGGVPALMRVRQLLDARRGGR
jgi:hypothetical protein